VIMGLNTVLCRRSLLHAFRVDLMVLKNSPPNKMLQVLGKYSSNKISAVSI